MGRCSIVVPPPVPRLLRQPWVRRVHGPALHVLYPQRPERLRRTDAGDGRIVRPGLLRIFLRAERLPSYVQYDDRDEGGRRQRRMPCLLCCGFLQEGHQGAARDLEAARLRGGRGEEVLLVRCIVRAVWTEPRLDLRAEQLQGLQGLRKVSASILPVRGLGRHGCLQCMRHSTHMTSMSLRRLISPSASKGRMYLEASILMMCDVLVS